MAKLIVTAPDGGEVKVARAASPAETATKVTAKPAAPPVPGVIQYDDFARVELRVAAVVAAERVEKADKLLRLTVDVGEGAPRTIVAGHRRRPTRIRRRWWASASWWWRTSRRARSAASPRRACSSPPASRPNLQVVTVGEGIAPGTRVK